MLDITNLKELLEKKRKDYPAFHDETVISNISNNLAFLSNFIPADIHLYQLIEGNNLKVIAESKPTIQHSFYRRSYINYVLPINEKPLLKKVFITGESVLGYSSELFNGLPCRRNIFPVYNSKKDIIAFLEVESNINEEMRLGEKQEVYREIVEKTIKTVISKALYETRPLPSFLPGDGLLIINDTGLIVYANPISLSIAKMLNFHLSLEGNIFSELFSTEQTLVKEMNFIYAEQDLTLHDITLNVKSIPVYQYVIVILRDITQLHSKEIELAVKSTIIKEVHHRVKNNLQTIVGLLRLQQRRCQNQEIKNILGETINRINSIAIVHEYLSQKDVESVNLKEMTSNILMAIIQSMVDPELKIDCEVVSDPDPIFFTSQKANSVALIINELIHNAVKHAFYGKTNGNIHVDLGMANNMLNINIKDNGIGLPKNFDPEKDANLGWQIILSLLKGNLMGDYSINFSNQGTNINIKVPDVI